MASAESNPSSQNEAKQALLTRFNTKYNELISGKKNAPKVKSDEDYDEIVSVVTEWAKGERFSTDQTKRNYGNRFSLGTVNNRPELLYGDKIVVKQSRLFEILYIVHTTGGHCGRDIMMKKVGAFFGITKEVIMTYLDCCETCKLKKGKAKKGVVVKPILSTQQNGRCQLDLIDLQSKPDREFKFILVYQDHLTKFVILRALYTKTAAEVAGHVKSIFSTFGAPKILQTDNGREFKNKTLEGLIEQWPGCKFVHGRPRHSQSQGSVERCNRDIQDIMWTTMRDRQTTAWADLLDDVQYMKNTRHHSGINRTPFKAMFGYDPPTFVDFDDYDTEGEELAEDVEGVEDEEDDADDEEDDVEDEAMDYELNVDGQTPVAEVVMDEVSNDLEKRDRVVQSEREEASQAMAVQADRMLQASNSRYGAIDVGTNVLIKISEVDKPKLGPRNVLAVVLEVDDAGFYRVGTKDGRLPNWYSRNQLEPVDEKFIAISEVPEPELKSFRAAVAKSSITGGQGPVKCACMGECVNNRCSCKKAGVQCNSRCHPKNSKCLNK